MKFIAQIFIVSVASKIILWYIYWSCIPCKKRWTIKWGKTKRSISAIQGRSQLKKSLLNLIKRETWNISVFLSKNISFWIRRKRTWPDSLKRFRWCYDTRQNKTTAQRLKDAVIGQIYATTKLRRQLQKQNGKYNGFVKRGSFCNSELSIDRYGSTYL